MKSGSAIDTPRKSMGAPEGSTKRFPFTEMRGRNSAFGFGVGRSQAPAFQIDFAGGVVGGSAAKRAGIENTERVTTALRIEIFTGIWVGVEMGLR